MALSPFVRARDNAVGQSRESLGEVVERSNLGDLQIKRMRL
jgi:hypothetical protein